MPAGAIPAQRLETKNIAHELGSLPEEQPPSRKPSSVLALIEPDGEAQLFQSADRRHRPEQLTKRILNGETNPSFERQKTQLHRDLHQEVCLLDGFVMARTFWIQLASLPGGPSQCLR